MFLVSVFLNPYNFFLSVFFFVISGRCFSRPRWRSQARCRSTWRHRWWRQQQECEMLNNNKCHDNNFCRQQLWSKLELKVKFRVHGCGTSPTSDTYPKLRHATRPAVTYRYNAIHCLCYWKKQFCGVNVQTEIFVILLMFMTSFRKMCNSGTKGSSKHFRVFFYENSI